MAVESGTISWFGGPQDHQSGPTTASGAPVSKPGVAVYNQATLGGWWLVKMPNGILTLIQQTDIGPAPNTGRLFDFTYSSLSSLGYSTHNFPTNAKVSGVYLGKTPKSVGQGIINGAASLGADVPNIAGWLKLVGTSPRFGATVASGSKAGLLDTGSVDLGNSAVQPGGPPNLASGGLSGLDALIAFITNGSNWVRLGEALLGALLLLVGIHALLGGDPVAVAKRRAGR